MASSRVLEQKTYEDVAFRYLAADQHPDHDTIAAFRQQHLETLAGLFTQALQLCQKAGLVKLGHVAIDGSKLQANASKHKAMSYGRMKETEQKLQAEVEEMLRRAQETDAAEDEQYGKGKRGGELPEELARRESRLRKIREARAALEAEARAEAEERKAAAEARIAERREQEERTGKKSGGRDPRVPDPDKAVPEEKAQRNFTDPESRIMPDGAHKGSFVQGYNAQIAVDGAAQIIVAAEVTPETNDKQQLVPMLERVEQSLGAQPQVATADAGYFGAELVSDERVQGIELYVLTTGGAAEVRFWGDRNLTQCFQRLSETCFARFSTPEEVPQRSPLPYGPAKRAPRLSGDKVCIRLRQWSGKQKHGQPDSAESVSAIRPGREDSVREQMKRKLQTEEGRAIYKMRKAIVEPVFGQIKEWRGFRRFRFRGLARVRAGWKLICLTHNLLKLFRSGWCPQMAWQA